MLGHTVLWAFKTKSKEQARLSGSYDGSENLHEGKKGGREMSYGKQQRKDTELCERRPLTLSSRGT